MPIVSVAGTVTIVTPQIALGVEVPYIAGPFLSKNSYTTLAVPQPAPQAKQVFIKKFDPAGKDGTNAMLGKIFVFKAVDVTPICIEVNVPGQHAAADGLLILKDENSLVPKDLPSLESACTVQT